MCRGARHTPSTAANMPIQRWYYVRCQHFISAHVRAYAIRPYTCSVEIRASLGENTITNRPIQSSCYHRINRKYVGAYRIRPPRRRTYQQKSLAQSDASLQIPLPLFFHLRPPGGRMPLRPYDFPVTQKQLYSHIIVCAIVLPSKMRSQMVNHHLPGVKGAFAIGKHGFKSEQNTSATCEMRTVSCAKRLSRLRWR